MDQMIWKLKLLVLWLFQALNFVAVLIVPYSFAIIREEIGEGIGALIAFYIFLTCSMMWLSVMLKPSVSRWPIVLVAAFYALVKVQWIIQGWSAEYALEFIFNEVWGLLAAVALMWYGWRIPSGNSGES